MLDAPIVIRSNGQPWRPSNFQGRFHGLVTLRSAFARSLNSATVRLALATGVDDVVDVARRLGVSSILPRNIATSLGACDVTPLEMVAAYGAVANRGHPMQPHTLVRVIDSQGRTLSQTKPRKAGEGISPATAYLLTDLLREVVRNGTGRRARLIGRPVAGKTGTTDEGRNVWFVGFSPDLVAGVWLGFDDNRPLGPDATGGQLAVPIWTAFMQQALHRRPARGFDPPSDVVLVPMAQKDSPSQSPTRRFVPLRREQAAQVLVSHGLLVSASRFQ